MEHSNVDLRQIAIFDGISPVALDSLISVSRHKTYRKDDVIFVEGDEQAPVFFVMKGIVRVYRTNPETREQTLIQLEEGAPFNLPAVFSGDTTAPASAAALTPATLMVVSQDDFRRTVLEHSDLALAILRNLSDRIRHLVDLTYDLSLRKVRGRLARFLLNEMDERLLIPDRWTRDEMAAQIGTVRAVVSRTLGAFSTEGLIRIDGRQITISNGNKLNIVAND